MKLHYSDFEDLKKEELIKELIKAKQKIAHYEETYLSRHEAAARLRKSPAFIDKCRATGILPVLKHDRTKMNSAVSFPLSGLVEYEQSRIYR